jgi:uncharacterized protein YndB with AHSA1/START domain
MKNPHQIQLEVTDHAYVMTRMFDAPIALVYHVWSDPQHFAKWWGPHTYTNSVEMDLRKDGAYRIVMIGPEGDKYPLGGEFLAVESERKLVLTMNLEEHPQHWQDFYNDARNMPAGSELPLVTTTVTFEAVGEKTKVQVEQRFEKESDRDAFIKLGTSDGWGQSFVKMDGLLASLQSEREIVLMRTLDAPRALVWQVWTDGAHIAKWWGPNGFTNTIYAHDFRAGGEWLYMMHGPDGTDYPNWMRFDEVIELERIAYTHGSVQDDPNAFHGVVTFEEVAGGKTHITMRVFAPSAAARTDFMAFGAFEGGDQTLGRFAAFLATA